MSCSQGIVCSNQNIDLFQPAVMFGVILCIGRNQPHLKITQKVLQKIITTHYWILWEVTPHEARPVNRPSHKSLFTKTTAICETMEAIC